MRRLLLGVMVLALGIGAASAQTYPNRPVRLVVTFPAGGAIDVLSRILADRLSTQLGERVVVDNRAGMGGTLGADVAAKAAPDGYTLVTASAASHAINKALFRSIPYDPERDFAPISMFATLPTVLVVHPSLPARTVAAFIAEAKRRPGGINYASIGNGSSQHLAGAYFELKAGVQLQHVPYKTAPGIATDLAANEVQAGFLFISNIIAFIQGGQVRPLAVTSRARMPALADVPTMIEAGLPDYEYINWFGVMGPAGLPPDIVARLHREIVAACRAPDLQRRFADLGALVVGDDPQTFARFVHAEIPKWAEIVKTSGARID
ncbi:MAG: tripartite tricarboxylate transporter substrate binding protein [Proteobacteria bacterium]|nr:tripartite tricarboxylate transporter substrate binding protein [Pseudomonadota bacterium]